ncbi:MAG: DUF455 family protein [Anaerolineales bacterium]|nr:DUF455 family protein [Anaerolineales bacterium]
MQQIYLPGDNERGRWMRLDAARILKRYFFCERALILSQSGWLAAIDSFDVKTLLPAFSWQDAMIANALRERVFELRFPNRMMEIGDDSPLIEVFDAARHAPNAGAFVLSLARVFKPALLAAYREYEQLADPLADGPILREIRMAISEKSEQIAALTSMAQALLRSAPDQAAEAAAWVAELGLRLLQTGGVAVEPPHPALNSGPVPGQKSFKLAEVTARDARFHRCRYYWPDVTDPAFPYGDGIRLQLRSAVSHFNEVWAVETGGAILDAFGEELGWEFIYDAARWTYDESRHTRMGYERLQSWGYQPEEIPLGSYIYDSALGQEPYIRLGMLHYFETKNIGKKTKRAEAFASYQDKVSQHDMDFDWADETIHAAYGHRWLDALRALYPERVPDIDTIRQRCDELVAHEVKSATPADQAEINAIAQAMIDKAERLQ